MALIAGDAHLSRLLSLVRERLDDDPGHDLGHALRVTLWTLNLGGPAIDPREGVAAGLLHDLVNVPKNSPDRHRASEVCADEAARLLPDFGFDGAAVERICDAIRDHSFSRGAIPGEDLGRALQDADRLEALGSIGIMRCVATGARLGGAFFHPEDPWARDRPLDDLAWSVDHFFKKLLKLPNTMQTDAGRREAARRAQHMMEFLNQLGAELGEPPPTLS